MRILGLALCLILSSSAAFAQGGIVLGRREFLLEFGHLNDQERSTTQGVTDFTFREKRFTERLLMRGDLSVVDPAFLTVNFSATFGFLQDRVFANGEKLPGRARLIGYDLAGNFLSEKNYSATVFANRSDNIDSREFIGTSETQNQSEGVILNLRGFILPSTLSYRQESFQEISHFGGLDARLDDSRNILAYDGQNHWESHDVGLHAEFAGFHDHVQPAFSYGSRTVNSYDRYRFGDLSPKLLTSRLNYIQRGGRLQFSNLTLDEDLRIDHSRSFSTSYDYLFSRSTSGGTETTSQTAAVSLQHRLFESLRTGASVRGSLVNVPGGGEHIFAARADTNYRKKLPGHGRLLASLGGLYQVSENRLPAGKEIPIFQESHTARVGVPFRLEQPRVVPGTILVTGSTGLIFQEDLDYLVKVVGEFTEIDILSPGRIREGDTLLVDYRVNVSAFIKFATRSMVFNTGPDFGWVNPYYSYERTLQNLLSGVAESPLENLRAHAAGIRFRWNGSKFSGTLQNEYRNQDSRLLPYRALQFSQFFAYMPRRTVQLPGGCPDFGGTAPAQSVLEQPKTKPPCSPSSISNFVRALTVGLSFDESFYHYRIPVRKTESGTGRLTIGWTPQPLTTVEAFASVRVWEDTLSPYENFRDFGVRIKETIGKVILASTFDAGWRRRNGSLMLGFRWSVDIMRRF